ncbi:uncharacterized protein LOC106666952 [Cimex lectularius]|uniref:Uncharacterized protein n=1 Tax=Cimex lectularius TaxID=79782 RepID=A0A8I6RTX4_CIMLE|nr:uncharacterized protein LOC106666952 [Cimex lectularius]
MTSAEECFCAVLLWNMANYNLYIMKNLYKLETLVYCTYICYALSIIYRCIFSSRSAYINSQCLNTLANVLPCSILSYEYAKNCGVSYASILLVLPIMFMFQRISGKHEYMFENNVPIVDLAHIMSLCCMIYVGGGRNDPLALLTSASFAILHFSLRDLMEIENTLVTVLVCFFGGRLLQQFQ